jgi:hypothetical protein
MTNINHVWTVLEGERYEGSYIMGVFRTRKRAEDWVKGHRFEFVETDRLDSITRYENGCDYIIVRRHLVG